MSRDRAFTRRRFLVLGGLAAAAVAGAGGVKLRGGEPRALTARVGRALNSEPVRAVGRVYLDVRGDEDDEDTLVELLVSRPEWRRVKTDADVRGALVQSSESDFVAGRVVNVGGWFLSESEARVCALSTFA